MHAFFEALAARANSRGAETALVSAVGTVSYAQLIERVRGHAQWARPLPSRVGLLFSKGPEQILADLALTFAGKELVPLPDFFSDAQIRHIIHATQLSEIVADPQNFERAARLGVQVHTLATDALPSHGPADDAGRIIFTSGTTGKPKGVRLRGVQVLASVAALAQASGAASSDRYLSILPSALLLEQIAGTYLPLSVGAMICVSAGGGAQQGEVGAALARAAEQAKPTATVLVPELLGAWLRELQGSGQRAPQSLRFVAVGGAPVSGTFADAAWGQGFPIYEGYGLSECCSVVALNTPGARRPGAVGQPLPNVQLTIANGEIVVNGPTLMDGYIGETPRQGPWHTGDLGRFDEDGFLWVSGRKDNVIVTAAGRNINPEWVEEQLTTDTRIKRCVVVEHERELVALVIPHDSSLCHDAPAMHDLVKWAARELPEYAKPRRYLPMSDLEFHDLDLLTATARPRRSETKRIVHERSRSFLVRLPQKRVPMSNFQQLMQETAPARQQFMEVPLIQEVLRKGASMDLYLDFLSQAYHHVKCTAPLLASAVGRCSVDDYIYQAALFEYIEEERGHELWILEDIQALGGDIEEVRRSAPRLPCKVMVGHAYYLIDRVSPYGMLGMIYVLEGMAVALASRAVFAIRSSIAATSDEGFKYLTTHSDLDVGHAEFFQGLIDKIDRRHLPLVIETASDFYKLYGDLFRELDQRRAVPNASVV